MKEHSVVTFRVMFNTDQQEKAECYAEVIEELLRGDSRLGSRYVLDVEIVGHEFRPGRSLHAEPTHQPGNADGNIEPR